MPDAIFRPCHYSKVGGGTLNSGIYVVKFGRLEVVERQLEVPEWRSG